MLRRGPLKSGVHRFACLALYRALLRQCDGAVASSSINPTKPRDLRIYREHSESPHSPNRGALDAALARHVIRQRFRQDARLQSPSQILEMLQQGYNALDVIRSLASTPQPALARAANEQLRLISRNTPYKRDHKQRRSPERRGASLSSSTTATSLGEGSAPAPPRPRTVFERPLSRAELSGPRHVPRFVSTMGFPFLRIKKPQPAVLSSLIRHKHKQKQRRLDHIAALDDRYAPLAQWEDEWDEMLSSVRQDKVPGLQGERADPSFVSEADSAKAAIQQAMRNEAERSAQVAARLWDIVKAERQLKYEEEGVLDSLLGRRTGSTDRHAPK